MGVQNAQEARIITLESKRIQREGEVQIEVDRVLSEITKIAEQCGSNIELAVNEELILDVINSLQNLGFIIVVLGEIDISVSW